MTRGPHDRDAGNRETDNRDTGNRNPRDDRPGTVTPTDLAPLAPPGDSPRIVADGPDLTSNSAAAPVLHAEESQWALVWREYRKRPLAIATAWTILLLAGLAVFSPLLANDRPLAYRGANRAAYAEGVRTVRVLLRQAAAAGDEATAVRAVADADAWLGRMDESLATDGRATDQSIQLDNLRRGLEATAAGGLTKAEAADARGILDTLTADRVVFRGSWAFPVFASLGGGDLFFMTLLAGLFAVLFARLFTPPWSREATRRAMLAVVIAPPIVGFLWWAVVPRGSDRTDYKAGVLTADAAARPDAPVLYETVVWPPVPYALDELNLTGIYQNPGWQPPAAEDGGAGGDPTARWDAPHLLGTDKLGRDVLSRMLWGGRISLSVGLVSVGLYVAIGILVGAAAGFFRGWVDMLISRIIEIVIVFPAFFLILTIVAFLGPSLLNIMIVIGLTGWTGVARLVRGEFLRLSDQEFVLAGRALGYSAPRLIFRHVLPNALAPVLVAATFGVGGAILTESALSFLGLGITVPTPSWGGILSEGRDALQAAPWLIYLPGFTIFLTIMAYNVAGEALRDASDPRLRGSR